MKREKLAATLARIQKKIDAMTDEEFAAELEKHKDGDIAQILRCTGADQIICDELARRRCPSCGSALDAKTNTALGLYYWCPNCGGSYIVTNKGLEEIEVER